MGHLEDGAGDPVSDFFLSEVVTAFRYAFENFRFFHLTVFYRWA